MAHAPFAPSSAKRWLTCTASYGAALHLPDPPESEYASDGTRLHDIAANMLMGRAVNATNEDVAFLAPYIQHCSGLRERANWHAVEKTIEHSPLLFGTPDFVALCPDGLHVVDLKTGAGVMVDPVENDQALAYAYMALTALWSGVQSLLVEIPTFLDVHVTIVQPTDEDLPVKTWVTTTERVWQWGREAEETMSKIVTGQAREYVPGEHCRWCKAKPVCPKLRGTLVGLPASLQPAELSPEATAEVLNRADLVLQFIDAVREHGHALASRGIVVPGWTLKPKRATRSWANPLEVIEWARGKGVLKQVTEPKLLSPAQVEKANKALYEDMARMAVAISSGTNLVRGNPSAPVALPEGASKTERLLANLETLKYRK